MKREFMKSGYPKRLVENIGAKVLQMERNLESQIKEKPKYDKIKVVSTFSADKEIVKLVKITNMK